MSNTLAVVFEAPEALAVRELTLDRPSGDPGELLIAIEHSGISTGTERLLYEGRMPPFPGLGYPLVPGYESVGRIVATRGVATRSVAPRGVARPPLQEGQRVFVPGASCFGEVRGLFGGSASRVRVPSERVIPVGDALGEEAVLLALAATAKHALRGSLPDLIVGHGVLGRLLARLTILEGGAPTVWEKNPLRVASGGPYRVCAPEEDERRDYRCIVDASGDARILDVLITRLARGGEIVLAGFYAERVDFAFPLAFLKEARFRVAAEWQREDLEAVHELAEAGRLELADLITHRLPASHASDAYATAFGDAACLKMILDWRDCA